VICHKRVRIEASSIATQKNGIVTRITEQLADLKERIRSVAAESGRGADTIHILAVSKKQAPETVREAFEAGLRDFGENYVQEALPKIAAVRGDPVWHFIGRIQSNKTRPIAEHFAWVHTVSSHRIAEQLSARRPAEKGDLKICIQVQPLAPVDGRTNRGGDRGGMPADEVPALADVIGELPRVTLRGLMMMPLPDQPQATIRREYARTRELLDQLRLAGHAADTLSMGMSSDLEAAIIEGSTLLRIGTALFGARDE
jgi:pyridoxal phosphate enzyme (YggS family)